MPHGPTFHLSLLTSHLIMFLILFLTLALSVFLAMLFIPRILILSYRKRLFDMPNKRKVHKTPVPRLGGVSFFPVIMMVFCFMMVIRYLYADRVNPIWQYPFFIQYMLFVVGMSILYFVGFYDDLVGVSYRYKFVAQIFAGSLLPLGGLWINDLGGLFGFYQVSPFIGMPLTVFMVVYITNAINLIDGIDGLASGLCGIALIVMTIVSALTAQWTFAILCAAILGVFAIFFYYNVFGGLKKKIFMGDAGSLTLGYILSFILLHYCQRLNWWNPFTCNLNIVAFSTLIIPLFDVVRVFASRIRDGRNPFMADKNHIHHKLMRCGMRIRYVMCTILLMSLSYIALNFALSSYINATLILFIDLALFVLMHIVINIFIAKREKKTGIKWAFGYKEHEIVREKG